MGKLIVLPVKKTRTKHRKLSLAEFQQRACLLQEAIHTICVSLAQDCKMLQKKKRIDYQQCSAILQIIDRLRQQTDKWSLIIHDDERLPFIVYTQRYPLLSACFRFQQQIDTSMNVIKTACVPCSNSSTEDIQLCQDIIRVIALLLEYEKKNSFEIFALLDHIRFYEQQRHVI